MSQMRTAAMVLGAMLAVPLVGYGAVGAQGAPAQAKAARAARSTTATRSITGVVKSINPTTLVVERGRGTRKTDMTFALDSSTHKDGDINVGSTVAIRYKTEASKLMAVSVQPVKQAARKAAAH